MKDGESGISQLPIMNTSPFFLTAVTTLINGTGHWCPLCVSSSAPEVDQKRSIFSALFLKRNEPEQPVKVASFKQFICTRSEDHGFGLIK